MILSLRPCSTKDTLSSSDKRPGKSREDREWMSHHSPDLDQHHTSPFPEQDEKGTWKGTCRALLSQNEAADGLLGWANQGCVFHQGLEFQEHKRFITSPEATERRRISPSVGVVVGWRSGD